MTLDLGQLAEEHKVEAAKGTVIFEQGAHAEAAFFLVAGDVVWVRTAEAGTVSQKLEPGALLAAGEVLSSEPYRGKATADSKCQLIRVDGPALRRVVTDNSEIALRILRQATDRIASLEDSLSSAPTSKTPRAADASARKPVGDRPAVDREDEKITAGPPRGAPKKVELGTKKPAPPSPPPAAGSASEGPLPAAINDGSKYQLRHTSGESFAIGAAPTVIVRVAQANSPAAEIELNGVDPKSSVSRRHAVLTVVDHHLCLLEEKPASNGTYLNGQMVESGKPMRLHIGDEIRFGLVQLTLEKVG